MGREIGQPEFGNPLAQRVLPASGCCELSLVQVLKPSLILKVVPLFFFFFCSKNERNDLAFYTCAEQVFVKCTLHNFPSVGGSVLGSWWPWGRSVSTSTWEAMGTCGWQTLLRL